MSTRFTGLLLLILLLLLSGLPLAAQEVALLQKAEVMIVRPGNAAPTFACAEEDCERLALLPAGARVWVIAQVEGRELEGSPQWYDVLLDCPCFDYERRSLENAPVVPVSDEGAWTLWRPRWSPDGTRIAAAADTDLYVWDAASGALLTQESHAPFRLRPPAWSPDGARMALVGLDHERQESQLLLLDATGQSPQPLDGHNGWITGATWSPDGNRIATIGDALRIWDAQQLRPLHSKETSASAIDWAPDGTRVVTAGYQDAIVRVWDAGSAGLLQTLGGKEDGQSLFMLQWSPDGAHIATIDILQGALHVWDAASGRLVGELETDEEGYVFSMAWTPDGRHILYALTGNLSGRLKRWSGMEQDHPQTLLDSRRGILNLSPSPAGHFLVADVEGKVRILDAADGRTLASLTRPDTQQRFTVLVKWSPHGMRIASSGTHYGQRVTSGTRQTSANVWDLTLIPEGPTRAFIHSSHLILEAPRRRLTPYPAQAR